MIRVLRILEYTYDTEERKIDDMARWGIHPEGELIPGPGKVIVSRTLSLPNVKESDNFVSGTDRTANT